MTWASIPRGAQRDDDLVGDGQVARAGGDHGDLRGETLGWFAPQQASPEFHDARVDRDAGCPLWLRARVSNTGPVPFDSSSATIRAHCSGDLPGP